VEIWNAFKSLTYSIRKNRRRICGSKGEEQAGGWRRLHNEELRNLYTAQNVIMVTQLRNMRMGVM
jgi:hypothetical protein